MSGVVWMNNLAIAFDLITVRLEVNRILVDFLPPQSGEILVSIRFLMGSRGQTEPPPV